MSEAFLRPQPHLCPGPGSSHPHPSGLAPSVCSFAAWVPAVASALSLGNVPVELESVSPQGLVANILNPVYEASALSTVCSYIFFSFFN